MVGIYKSLQRIHCIRDIHISVQDSQVQLYYVIAGNPLDLKAQMAIQWLIIIDRMHNIQY